MKTLLGPQAMVVEFYGSTEVSGVSAVPVTREREFGLLGDIMPGRSLYIQDTETGEKLGPGKLGKIMVKTDSMMKEFFKKPEVTKEFRDADGYGFTGDIGYYTEKGDIYFSHRMSNALKVKL